MEPEVPSKPPVCHLTTNEARMIQDTGHCRTIARAPQNGKSNRQQPTQITISNGVVLYSAATPG